jgi:hypothetical protein
MDFETERRNVGQGWWPIVDKLHQDLLALDPDYQVAQIKEKFGELRYYIYISEGIDGETQQKMDALTAVAEERSLTVCEKCGAPGKPDTSRWWLKTTCEAHDPAHFFHQK